MKEKKDLRDSKGKIKAFLSYTPLT